MTKKELGILEEVKSLLGRLDERTSNTWRTVEKIEKHQETQNGHIKFACEAAIRNTAWITILKWAFGLIAVGILSWLTRIQWG